MIILDIGIPTYNRSKDLFNCLESIENQTMMPRNIIVCNDASSDDTIETVNIFKKRLKEKNVDVLLINNGIRRRSVFCRNEILKFTDAEIIVFIDDDIYCNKDWLVSIIQCYSDQKVGAVGGPALLCNEDLVVLSKVVNSERNLNIMNKYGEHMGYHHCWVPPNKVETDLLIGANFSFRTNLLKNIRGFDANYKYIENLIEEDIMVQFKKNGFKIIYEPKAMVYHKLSKCGGHRSQERDKRFWYWWGINSIYFINKHFSENKHIAFIRLLFRLRKQPTPFLGIIFATLFRDNRTLAQKTADELKKLK